MLKIPQSCRQKPPTPVKPEQEELSWRRLSWRIRSAPPAFQTMIRSDTPPFLYTNNNSNNSPLLKSHACPISSVNLKEELKDTFERRDLILDRSWEVHLASSWVLMKIISINASKVWPPWPQRCREDSSLYVLGHFPALSFTARLLTGTLCFGSCDTPCARTHTHTHSFTTLHTHAE